MALYLQDKHPMAYELEVAEYAEAKGFTEIWQADTRLARDCVVMMSALLTRTKATLREAPWQPDFATAVEVELGHQAWSLGQGWFPPAR